MRRLALILSLLSLQACLSGCSVLAVADAAVTVVATTVSVGATVVGTAVDVGLPSAEARSVVAVPRDAVILRREGDFVLRVDPAGKAERLAVKTGAAVDDLVEVSGDVRAGDRLIVRGGERVEPGQAVSVQPLAVARCIKAATLKAAATVDVHASADDTLVALTPSGGKAEDTGVSLLGAVVLTDNQVRALVDATAQLHARNVLLDARQGLTAGNGAAALTSGGAGSGGVGLSLADIHTDTQARVGLGMGTSEDWLRPAGVAVSPFSALPMADQGIRVSDTLTVDAQTQAMIVSLGVMASDTSNDDPDTYEGPANKPSAAAALKQKATDKMASTRTAAASLPSVGRCISTAR